MFPICNSNKLLSSVFLALLVAVGGILSGCASGQQQERPNILIIMADDMGYSDIGAYGGEIKTPALDRLAKNGIRFTNFYNVARCCPTRAALLTGRHPHQAGMAGMVSSLDSEPEAGPYQGYLNKQSATIAEVLSQSGYRTYMSGKWHVGEKPEHWPTKRGFDHYFGLISGASSYYKIRKDQPRVRQMVLDGKPWDPPEEGFYMTDATSEYANRWLDSHAGEHSEKPFFLYVAYTAPHWPLHAPEKVVDKYEGRYMIGWDSLRAERFARMQKMGILTKHHQLTPRPENIPAWKEVPREERKEWDRRMAVYAAMVDRMDQGIGRILEKLEAQGELENTLVLFLSDNGGSHENIMGRGLHNEEASIGSRGSFTAYRRPWANASNTPFRRYKSWAHEGGIATPLIAHWPKGINQDGRLNRSSGYVLDLMATSVDVAGATYPDSLDGHRVMPVSGKSLVPVFKGVGREGHQTMYWEHFGARAVREGTWKLVKGRGEGPWELYNLKNDPTETKNLADQEPRRVEHLKAKWTAWADSVGVQY